MHVYIYTVFYTTRWPWHAIHVMGIQNLHFIACSCSPDWHLIKLWCTFIRTALHMHVYMYIVFYSTVHVYIYSVLQYSAQLGGGWNTTMVSLLPHARPPMATPAFSLPPWPCTHTQPPRSQAICRPTHTHTRTMQYITCFKEI